jgi:hypothetical protein
VKKLLAWLALGIAVIWVINDPTGAALAVRHLITAVTTLVHGL